jgi:methylenetetrahydrofolate dehydrogenase (NADP+)/methenyltetrahydrofolate cyclohydrolase
LIKFRVIDVGINHLAKGSLCGKVDFNMARQRASRITPVHDSLGPMTVATLPQNTLSAAMYFNP